MLLYRLRLAPVTYLTILTLSIDNYLLSLVMKNKFYFKQMDKDPAILSDRQQSIKEY